VRDLKVFNLALLGKGKWRLGKEKHSSWKDVFEPKYGSWRSLNNNNETKYESLWWRDLRKVYKK